MNRLRAALNGDRGGVMVLEDEVNMNIRKSLVAASIVATGAVLASDLVVLEDGAAIVRFRIGASGAAEFTADESTGSALKVVNRGTGDILTIHDDAVQVLTVRDGGYVGVGTASPALSMTRAL